MSKSETTNPQKPAGSKPITLVAVAKLQSRYAKAHDGKVPKNSWIARLQRVAQRNTDLSNN